MSKKTIIIIVIVIVVLAVSFAAWYFTRKKNNPEAPEDKMFLKDQKGKVQVSPLLKDAITKVKVAGIRFPGIK